MKFSKGFCNSPASAFRIQPQPVSRRPLNQENCASGDPKSNKILKQIIKKTAQISKKDSANYQKRLEKIIKNDQHKLSKKTSTNYQKRLEKISKNDQHKLSKKTEANYQKRPASTANKTEHPFFKHDVKIVTYCDRPLGEILV